MTAMIPTQSVCKHCGGNIVKLPTYEYWRDSSTLNPFCNGRHGKTHEPVSEPASTGEPTLNELVDQYWGPPLKSFEPAAPQPSAEPPCRTPGAVYHFKLARSEQSGREILTLHVYMPQEISIVEAQAQSIEEKLHDACEGILSAYWPNNFSAAPQPVAGDAPKVEELLITDARLQQIKQIRAYGLQAEPTALLLAIDDLMDALRLYSDVHKKRLAEARHSIDDAAKYVEFRVPNIETRNPKE